jgi:hypothetical protein
MTNDHITIPPEALEAARQRLPNVCTIDDIRTACLAMLQSWKGMTVKRNNEHVALFNSDPAIILPLTEPSDDK